MNQARTMQQIINDLIFPEKLKGNAAHIPDSLPVDGGLGRYWYGGRSDSDPDGDDEDPEDPNDPNGDDDDDGGNGDDGTHDPTKTPEEGDDITGIGPLFDCNNPGKCINVRLNGIAKPPEGKETPCPPEGSGGDYEEPEYVYYWTAVAYWVAYDNKTRVSESGVFDSEGAAKGFVSGIIPKGQKSDGTSIPDFSNTRGDDNAGSGRIISDGGYYEHEKPKPSDPMYFSFSITRTECKISNSSAECKAIREELRRKWESQNENWGGDECSEVVAKDGTFQPACPDSKDKNIPPMFNYAPTAFTLCDENGNPVTVEPYGMGYKITTPTYEAIVNSDFKVQHVYPKL